VTEIQQSMLTIASKMRLLTARCGLDPLYVDALFEAAKQEDTTRFIDGVPLLFSALAESRQAKRDAA